MSDQQLPVKKEEEIKLPSIADIYNDESMTILQKDIALQVLLNKPPHKSWLKEHPTAKKKDANGKSVPIQFIPIERVEWLLTVIYLRWRPEILSAVVMGNSVCVTVRLHYFDHAKGEWDWVDGIGAQPLQTDSGTGANNVERMKSNAVQIAAPAAKSYAIKDAAECLGRIFGKDLNRAENVSYDTLIDKYAKAVSND